MAAGGLLERLVRALCPRPEHSLLLIVSHDELVKRLAEKKEPFPDSDSVREARWGAYERLGETKDVELVPASGTVEEVHARVMARLGLSGRKENSGNAHL